MFNWFKKRRKEDIERQAEVQKALAGWEKFREDFKKGFPEDQSKKIDSILFQIATPPIEVTKKRFDKLTNND